MQQYCLSQSARWLTCTPHKWGNWNYWSSRQRRSPAHRLVRVTGVNIDTSAFPNGFVTGEYYGCCIAIVAAHTRCALTFALVFMICNLLQ